jgi:hypothetical protein
MRVALLVPMSSLSKREILQFFNTIPRWISTLVCVVNGDNLYAVADAPRPPELSLTVVVLSDSVGKAEAIRRGLLAIESIDAIDWVAQADGRGKQALSELYRLRDEMLLQNADLTIANRYGKQNLKRQRHRQAIGRFFREIIESVYGLRLTDYFCGTRLYTREMSRHFISGQSFGYGLELEQLIIACKLNATVAEVPVKSNLQNNFTETEKIEDVFHLLLQMIPMKPDRLMLREVLSICLHKIKRRDTFDLCLPLKSGTHFRFEHNARGIDFRGSYASQTPLDVYSVIIKES